MKPQNTTLSFKDAKSDKVYNASLEKSGKLFIVNFAYGKRDGNLKEGTKTPTPVTYEKALAIYEKLVKSKTDKGYQAATTNASSTKEAPKKPTKNPAKKAAKQTAKKKAKKPATKANEKARDTDALLTKLKALIKSQKSPVALLNSLNETERNNLRPTVIELLKKKNSNLRKLSLVDKQIFYSFVEEFHKELLADSWFLGRLAEFDVMKDLIDHYRPAWLEKHMRVCYLDKMYYFKKGYMKTPFQLTESARYKMEYFINQGYSCKDEKDPCAFLYKYKETLEEHIWLLFSRASEIHRSGEIWIDLFQKLIDNKKITRKKLMGTIQNFKHTDIKGKGLYGNQYEVANWVYQLLKALKPTTAELLVMQDTLIENLSLKKAATVRKFSIDFLEEIVSTKGFDVTSCIQQIAANMESINIPLSRKLIKLSSAILKQFPKQKEALAAALANGNKNANKKVRDAVATFFENELQQEVTTVKQKPKVKPKGSLSDEQIEKVSSLLLSIDDASTKVALSILENQPFPVELMTEIFLLYHTTPDDAIKKIAEGLIKEHGSQDLQKRRHSFKSLGTPAELESANENTIKKNIKKLVTGNELDGVKLAKALYKKYGVGANYLLYETDEADQKEMLQTFIKGTVLKINGLALPTFPGVTYEFPELTEIDISDNNIKSIPAKIKTFKNLKVLNLAKNGIENIHKNITQLDRLEEFYINKNHYYHPLPEFFFDLVSLKKLDISGTSINSDSPIQGFQKLTNLIAFRMENESRTYEPIYDDFPNITIKITGNPLNMDPLSLAKTAFKQGNKSANGFLMDNGGAEDRLSVLKSLYDQKTKTMNLENLEAKGTPEEIKDFEIKHLLAKKSYTGLRMLEAFPKHFAKLETLDLTDVERKKSPDFSLYKNLKTLILKDCDLVELVNLKSLKNLEELSLYSNDLAKFPEEIFEFSNLKELELFLCTHYEVKPTLKTYDGLKNLKKLVYLSISNDAITEEEIQKLLPKKCTLSKY